jgi:hypothetical protein
MMTPSHMRRSAEKFAKLGQEVGGNHDADIAFKPSHKLPIRFISLDWLRVV